jgi:hypothetical protein
MTRCVSSALFALNSCHCDLQLVQTASQWHRRIRLRCRQNRQVGASPLRKSSTSTARQHVDLARSSPRAHRGEELRAGRRTAQGSGTKALLAKACGSCLGVILFGRELSVGRHTLAPRAPAEGGTICRISEGTFVGETNYHSVVGHASSVRLAAFVLSTKLNPPLHRRGQPAAVRTTHWH